MENRLKDPVCGRGLYGKNVAWSYMYLGQMYYFCTHKCLIAFDRDPENFALRISI
jgi:YHS domain-containing protein